MNLIEFEKLCREASEQLALEDTRALGLGFGVCVQDVVFETTYVDGQDSFLLLADIGAVEPEDRVSVYESLLAIQLAAWDEPRVRFGFHPMHDAAVLCMGVSIGEKTDGPWLAGLLRAVAAQVAQWRTEQLAGKAGARDSLEAGSRGAEEAASPGR
jgi:hypothetical protein